MHRRNSFLHEQRSFSGLSQRKYNEVSLALREQKLRSDRSKKSPLVSGSFAGGMYGRAAEDCEIAIQAASQLVQRLGKTVVIQDDLSVVPESKATRRILERFTTDDVI